MVGLWLLGCGIALVLTLHSCAVLPQVAEDYTLNPSRSEDVAIRQKKRTPSEKPQSPRPVPKSERVVHKKRQPSPSKDDESKRPKAKEEQPTSKELESRSPKAGSPHTERAISSTEMKERLAVVKYARKYKGVRYRYGGDNPFGFDCSGFTEYVFKKIDIFLPRNTRAQAEVGEKIPLQAVAPGDLLFFGERGKITHVAIVTANEGDRIMMIHSTNSKGVVEEDLLSSEYWMERFLFARNIIGS